MGTDPDFDRAYNEADPAAKEDMKWNQAEADKWWDSASPEEITDQYDAAKEAKAYDIGRKSIDWGIDYTDADTRNDYAETNNLHPGKFKQFLYGTPDERHNVIRETNARLQPWNPKWTETDNALLEPAPSPNAYASDALAPPHNSWT